MVLVHISIINNELFLWGEQGDTKASEATVKSAECPDFPYDRGGKGLINTLKLVVPEIKSRKSMERRSVVWLPTRGNIPIPSSPVVGMTPDQRQKRTFRPYRTTSQKVSLEELLEVVSLAGTEGMAGTGVLFGSTVAWCGRVVKIILNMAAKESFLPGLVKAGDRWEARWIPLPDESDERALAVLTAEMPGAFRCMGDSA